MTDFERLAAWRVARAEWVTACGEWREATERGDALAAHYAERRAATAWDRTADLQTR